MIGAFRRLGGRGARARLRPGGGRLSRRDARRATASRSAQERVWPLLDLFFDSEMHRQNIVPGAVEALAGDRRAWPTSSSSPISATNIRPSRVAQLEAFDIRHRVLCNRGGKGRPVARADRGDAAARHALRRRSRRPPRIGGEARAPGLAAAHDRRAASSPRSAPPAPHAHARIDDWDEALPWILERLAGPAA